MVTALPTPTLHTGGEIEHLSPRMARFVRALLAIEHILDISDTGSVTMHYGAESVTVIPAPSVKIKI